MHSILRLANQPQAAAWGKTRTELTGNNRTTSRGRAPGTAKGTIATQRKDALPKIGAGQSAFFNRTNFPRLTTPCERSSGLQGRSERQDR